MKSTDKLTKEQLLPSVIGYSRKNKCDLIIFDRKCCGADFMLKKIAEKSGIKGILVEYGESQIIIRDEKNKIIDKVKTDIDKIEKKSKKNDNSSKNENKSFEIKADEE